MGSDLEVNTTFDKLYTAPAWGFETVEQFYAETSSNRVIGDVRVPTLLIASADDPLVPVELFEPLASQNIIKLHVTKHGWHLGFIGRLGTDPDRRWMDWRIVDYVLAGRVRITAAAA